MSYKVEYTTDTKPVSLPDGAKVTEISRLPFKSKSLFRELEVKKRPVSGGVQITIHDTDNYPAKSVTTNVSEDMTRSLITALQEAVGDVPAPDAPATAEAADQAVELPFKVKSKSFNNNEVRVEKSIVQSGAYLSVGGDTAALTMEDTRDLAYALLQTIGEPPKVGIRVGDRVAFTKSIPSRYVDPAVNVGRTGKVVDVDEKYLDYRVKFAPYLTQWVKAEQITKVTV